MEILNWEEERKLINENAIAQHERLHKLFKENRFAFEIERKKMINEIIENAANEDQKKRLKKIQESWDNKMKKAGTKSNRFTLAQHLFWEHVENIWNPFIQEFSRELSSLVKQRGYSKVIHQASAENTRV